MLKTKRGLTPELERALLLWEDKATEMVETCREFLDLVSKMRRAERGSDRYLSLMAEASGPTTMLYAKAKSLEQISQDVTDALPDDD